jgi:UDP-glucose 4-epimerase
VKRACITGGAGFIGSNLAGRLADLGVEVVIVDDFRSGRREFLAELLTRPRTRLVEGDVLDRAVLDDALEGCDWVFHLQANADVRHGLEHPRRDLEQNTIATANVLEAMRARGVRRIAFSSTGSVYGEPTVFPTPEDAPFPLQTSLYGASKLACEGLISAYATGFGFTGVICRFVSILGERYTHGHVFDFYRALKRDPTRLRVLGDGRQRKSYLYVRDCVAAMLVAAERHGEEPGAHVYNLGAAETVVVDDSLRIILEHLSLEPEIEHGGGRRGWVGDSPLIELDVTRIRDLGWRPQVTIREAIVRTLVWLDANEYAWREQGPDRDRPSARSGQAVEGVAS